MGTHTNLGNTQACGPSLQRTDLHTHLYTAKAIGLPGIHDSTVYGSSRASTHSFYYHHLSIISFGIVHADALTLTNHAANESILLTLAAPA